MTKENEKQPTPKSKVLSDKYDKAFLEEMHVDTENFDMHKLSHNERVIVKEAKKEASFNEKPIHFHVLSLIIHFIIFIIALAAFGAPIGAIMGGFDFEPTSNQQLILGLISIIGFVVVVAEIQLAWRRFFRIGRNERVRNAVEKHDKHIEKFKKKHSK